MIDKNKYLYWLNANDPKLEQEIIYREMYSRIGLVFHLIQMIEYNIANILSLEEYERINGKAVTEEDIEKVKFDIDEKYRKLSKFTFGRLKNEIKHSKYLTNIDLAALGEIIDYRNYLAHQCFKEKLLIDKLSTVEDIDEFVNELNDFEVTISKFNDWLIKVFKKHKIKQVILNNNYINL